LPKAWSRYDLGKYGAQTCLNLFSKSELLNEYESKADRGLE